MKKDNANSVKGKTKPNCFFWLISLSGNAFLLFQLLMNNNPENFWELEEKIHLKLTKLKQK